MTKKEKFLTLVSKEETKTVARAKIRLAKKNYTKISNLIAFEILECLDELGWSQVKLAEEMGVSKQQVNKWVKGNENFTLDTLSRLGEVLGIQLIQIPNRNEARVTSEKKKHITEYQVPSRIKQIHPVITRRAVV